MWARETHSLGAAGRGTSKSRCDLPFSLGLSIVLRGQHYWLETPLCVLAYDHRNLARLLRRCYPPPVGSTKYVCVKENCHAADFSSGARCCPRSDRGCPGGQSKIERKRHAENRAGDHLFGARARVV